MDQATPHSNAPYLVLARKYRPKTFDELIGQDVLVRTLRNAFTMKRIAQAYMLTGVRGVGKTTTARILARALNYQRAGAPDEPSLDLSELGIHCQAIMESRHVDVLEMDAASNTGIDDIREIIEAVRYKPATARYRVFIIDEVHMLSKAAFNGLLKTLEEPPPHVKFIFATTEIRKVPLTVLSRCQRFDLRRVSPELLSDHFASIARKEGREAEKEALDIIARAAEGSVRDGLSLLDQAFALSDGPLRQEMVLEMLGLAGRNAIFSLLSHIFAGDAGSALAAFTELHDRGSDPVTVLTDLADAVHSLTRLKAVSDSYPADFTAADRAAADALAAKLSVPRLSMAWQMLIKGLDEAGRAPRPHAAAEMLIIRMCYASGLPSPAEVIGGGGSRTAEQYPRAPLAPSQPRPAPVAIATRSQASAQAAHLPAQPQTATRSFPTFESIAAYAGEIRDIKLKVALEEQVELVKFAEHYIELHLLPSAPKGIAQELARKLQGWTSQRWVVSLSETRGAPPLGTTKRAEEARTIEEMRRHPAVKNVLHHFPNAEIKSVRTIEGSGERE